jgi:hypothetical protein
MLFIVEIEGFDLFMLMLNAKLEHSPLIDPDDVEESVLVKNAIQQAKKYQEQLWVIVLLMLLIHHLLYLVYLTSSVVLGTSFSRKPIYWCCRDERKLSAEIKSLLTDQDFIVEIEGFVSQSLGECYY